MNGMSTLDRLHALLRLSEQIGQARTPGEMYEAALDCVEGALQISRASILMFDDDGVMRFKAWRGISDAYRAAVEGHTPWTRGQRVDAPLVVEDARVDASSAPYRETFAREGIVGLVFVPLRVDGGVIGKFMLYHAQPAQPDADQVRQMLAVADQIALAVTRRRSEDQLRAANGLLGSLLENLREGVIFTDAERRLRFINDAARRLLQLLEDGRLIGRPAAELRESISHAFESREELLAQIEELVAARAPVEDLEFRLRDGRVFMIGYAPVFSEGRFEGHLWQLEDLTMRRRLETQLLQAQRLESVGRLAGGIAHDFNNLLTAIQGYVELVRFDMPPDSPASRHLREALVASQQASTLTRRLLTFARRQPAHPRTIDLCGLLARMEPMLRQLVREDIDLVLRRCDCRCWVRADEGQIEQVFVNLVLNARDAMPNGGRLSISTAPDGPDVRLEVADTGVGMDEATLARVFEPFFTTKELGGGTGLGLSTVHGIVEQCGGRIDVRSRPGEGSTFRVRFPMVAAPASASESAAPEAEPERGCGRVLLVEDDVRVRELTREMLERLGYTVLAADGPEQALALAAGPAGGIGEIDVILSDIVMPGMDGRALTEQLQRSHPRARVVLMSGYAPPARMERETVRFLAKPFRTEALARVLAEARGARPLGAA